MSLTRRLVAWWRAAPVPAGLRPRLLLLVLIALAPAFALSLYSAAEQRHEAVEAASEDALRYARVIAAAQAQADAHARAVLAAWARYPELAVDGEPCMERLRALFAEQRQGEVGQVQVVLPDGRVRCGYPVLATAVDLRQVIASNPADVFRRTLDDPADLLRRTGPLLLGTLSAGAARADPSAFGYPIRDSSGQLQAVLLASFSTAWLNDYAVQARVPEGATVQLLGPDAAVHMWYPVRPTPPLENTAVVRRALAEQDEATAEVPDGRGRPRFYAFAHSARQTSQAGGDASTGDVVVVSLPAGPVYARADRVLRRNLSLVTLVGLLALGAAWIGSDVFVLRRVRALASAARRLGAGDLTVRTGAAGSRGELGQLARTFDEMAAALQVHEADRVQQALTQFELTQAAEVQSLLLPRRLPAWPGKLELAVRYRPAREASGDFYDVVELPAAETHLSLEQPLQIAVGDVAGKGMAAALVMAVAQTTLRLATQTAIRDVLPVAARSDAPRPADSLSAAGATGRARAAGANGANGATGATGATGEGTYATPVALLATPAATARQVSGWLNERVGRSRFVACALAEVEVAGDGAGVDVRLVNAGQVPVLRCRDGATTEFEPPGPRLPLGVLSDTVYEQATVRLRPGDVLIFSSDGLVEAPEQATGELFGFERLARCATAWTATTHSAEAVAEGMWHDLTAWCGAESHHDDMTLLILRVPA